MSLVAILFFSSLSLTIGTVIGRHLTLRDLRRSDTPIDVDDCMARLSDSVEDRFREVSE